VALSKRHRAPLIVFGLAIVVGVVTLTTQKGAKAEKSTLIDIQKDDLSRISVDWYPDRDTRYDKALEKAKKKAEKLAAESGAAALAESSESSESSESASSTAPEGDVKRIALHKVAEGEDEYWVLDEPIQCRIDPSTADGLVGKLAMLKADRLVDFEKGEVEDDSSLGLDRPVARVQCEGKRGSATTLMIGRKQPTSTSERYARVEGDRRVAIVAASLLSDLTREAKDIRDKRVFTLKSDEVKTLVAGRDHTPTKPSGESGESAPESESKPSYGNEKKTPATDSYTLTKGEDENGDPKWAIAGEVTADADSNEVSTLVSTLTSKRAEDFVADKPTDAELAQYGLTNPAQTYTLTGRKKHTAPDNKREWRSETTETLEVGYKTPDGKSYYIRVSWRPEIMKVAAEGFDIVSKSASDLRDKAMHKIAQKDLLRIETTRGGFQAKLEYDKKDKKWNLADGSKTKEFAASGLVSGLANLSISKFIAEEATDLATYGLDQPQATVVLTPKKGDPVTIYFGKQVEGDTSLLYAKRSDRDQIVAVDSYRLYSIPEKLSDIAETPAPPKTESAESGESAAAMADILQ